MEEKQKTPPPAEKNVKDALDGHQTDPMFEVTAHLSTRHANRDSKWRCTPCSTREDSGEEFLQQALHLRIDLVFDRQERFFVNGQEIASVMLRNQQQLLDAVARSMSMNVAAYKKLAMQKRSAIKRKRLQ